ncbi:MAG TPA: hypothetical protein VFI23_19090 [Rhizomicrobium sp.]|nr:hypothetical protein [Rhizomicrobium sp.]
MPGIVSSCVCGFASGAGAASWRMSIPGMVSGWVGAGAGFFADGFLAGGLAGFFGGIAMPGISSIFMPPISMAPLPDGEADCAAGLPDNRITSVIREALAPRIASLISILNKGLNPETTLLNLPPGSMQAWPPDIKNY